MTAGDQKKTEESFLSSLTKEREELSSDPPLIEQQEPWVKPQVNLRSSYFFAYFSEKSATAQGNISKSKKKAGLIKISEKNHRKFTHHLGQR